MHGSPWLYWIFFSMEVVQVESKKQNRKCMVDCHGSSFPWNMFHLISQTKWNKNAWLRSRSAGEGGLSSMRCEAMEEGPPLMRVHRIWAIMSEACMSHEKAGLRCSRTTSLLLAFLSEKWAHDPLVGWRFLWSSIFNTKSSLVIGLEKRGARVLWTAILNCTMLESTISSPFWCDRSVDWLICSEWPDSCPWATLVSTVGNATCYSELEGFMCMAAVCAYVWIQDERESGLASVI